MSIVEEVRSAVMAGGAHSGNGADAGVRRGRPLMVSREAVLEQIRQLAAVDDGLYRVHHRHPDLYARARRMFGSWSRAVAVAGLDYGTAIEAARQRSLVSRRARNRRIANGAD